MKIIKPFIFIWITFFVFQYSSGQTPSQQPKQKSIHVNGSAEMEIIPDELFFTVILREYLDKDKKKVKIESLEKELQSSVSAAGVAKENLQFENVFGERWKEKRGKPEDFLKSKSYTIKLSEPSKIDVILDKIDTKGIENVYLSNYSHSKIEQYRKELKIQAIKNTKEKAKYLLEAIGEQMGGTLSIVEENSDYYPQPMYNLCNTSQTSYNADYAELTSEINFKTIKLRFSINGEFEIK